MLPSWPAPARVRALCSTRIGGFSTAPYDSLNLGDHVGDDPAAVVRNRQAFAQALRARPVYLKQVHGRHTAVLRQDTPDGCEADACITQETGLACTIMVADCLPVLFATDDGRAVAAAHAGWRGLAGEGGQGVLESVTGSLANASGVPPQRMLAWLGPCIGPAAFEVGGEVRAAFSEADPAAEILFTAHGNGKWLADLPGLARRRLAALGMTQVFGNDGSLDWCTVANPSRFFSHRRDRVSGRIAAAVWIE